MLVKLQFLEVKWAHMLFFHLKNKTKKKKYISPKKGSFFKIKNKITFIFNLIHTNQFQFYSQIYIFFASYFLHSNTDRRYILGKCNENGMEIVIKNQSATFDGRKNANVYKM